MREDRERMLVLLRLATRLIDEAVAGVSATTLEPVRDNIAALRDAIGAVAEVMTTIYRADPELRPLWLAEPNPHPGVSRVFGELLIEVEDLQMEDRTAEAIAKLEAFLETEPPELFRDLAKSQLERLGEPEGSE